MTKLEAFSPSPEWYPTSPMNQPKLLLEGNTCYHPGAYGTAQQFNGDVDVCVLGVGLCKGKTSFHSLSIVILESVHQTFHYWEHSENCIILILEMEHN